MHSFPFLSTEEFVSGCKDLEEAFEASSDAIDTWSTLETRSGHDQIYLRILKYSQLSTLTVKLPERREEDLASNDVEEIDEHIFPGAILKDTNLLMEYHIIHSPIYRVPVLWILGPSHACSQNADLEYLYENIVPRELRQQMEHTGLYGGVSLADHPILGIPAYFIHPCYTAEAMKSVSIGDIEPMQYLILWLGLVGGSVQLSVPRPLALEIVNR